MNNFVNIYRRRHIGLTRPTLQLFLSKRIWNLDVNICSRGNFVLTWVMKQNCVNERSHQLDSGTNTSIRGKRFRPGTSLLTYLLVWSTRWRSGWGNALHYRKTEGLFFKFTSNLLVKWRCFCHGNTRFNFMYLAEFIYVGRGFDSRWCHSNFSST
jgi:hypothetical protein